MAGRTDGLIKNFRAGAVIPPRRFLKFGADDQSVVLAAAPTDAIIGASGELAAAEGEPCDVHMSDIAEVEYGGNVTRGDFLTSDANGRAVAAAPATGVNNRVGGIAMASGVASDIGAALIVPTRIQG